MKSKTYSTRAAAVRAARQACRKALNAPAYEAHEGVDYTIHPRGRWDTPGPWYRQPHGYELLITV